MPKMHWTGRYDTIYDTRYDRTDRIQHCTVYCTLLLMEWSGASMRSEAGEDKIKRDVMFERSDLLYGGMD
jgi:hypothetical protein